VATKQGALFDQRFLDQWIGSRILRAPRTAIVELVANAWDSGARRVDITWPNEEIGVPFSIKDNGEGMTVEQFRNRWRRLAYNRVKEQGPTVRVVGKSSLPPRHVYGRNGIGRFAGLCFADEYFVETSCDGISATFKVTTGRTQPIEIELLSTKKSTDSGTQIFVKNVQSVGLSAEDAKSEIGMRFLADPNFEVFINKRRVGFNSIPHDNVQTFEIEVPEVGSIEIVAIDTKFTDRNTHRHGIAWRVKKRLVGECSWKSTHNSDLIDGRRLAAKRFTFLVTADCLDNAVKPDWSGFDEDNTQFQEASKAVNEIVEKHLYKSSSQDRRRVYQSAVKANREQLSRMSLRGVDKWARFVKETQDKCPSIRQKDLVQLSSVLAGLEESESRYGLIHKLGELETGQLDELHKILEDWTLDMAKTVLDEVRNRLELVDELRQKLSDKSSDEVQELQPLFKQGLWIFGPEFESIEFTSNEGMTKVITELFKPKLHMNGSRLRPDFAIVTDGTVGLYTHPKYDPETMAEVGVSRLVIIELKRPGIVIGTEQKEQCWKYVKELYSRGLLLGDSKVTCFALGSELDPIDSEVRTDKQDMVRIQPLAYETILARAKSRMLKLYDKVRNAPFLDRKERKELESFWNGGNVKPTQRQRRLKQAR
jgi:hypothetical protein